MESPTWGAPLVLATLGIQIATGSPQAPHRAASWAVAAGAAIGTRALWGVPPRGGAAVTITPGRSPRVWDGAESMTVVINASAGGDDEAIRTTIEQSLPDATVISDPPDLMDALRHASDATVIGIAGGDGSVNAAAGVAVTTDRPLAVFPGGTLNHFARDLGLLSADDTLEAIRSGVIGRVDLGTVGDGLFLNTASFGSYVELVDAREQLEPRLGKWLAMAVAAGRILLSTSPSEVEINGRPESVWLIFIGNCEYQPPGLAPGWRERLDDGMFDIRWIDAGVRWSRVRLVLALLTGQLGKSAVYRRMVTPRLVIRSLGEPLRLAVDGEIADSSHEVVVAKHPVGLDVFIKQRASDGPDPH